MLAFADLVKDINSFDPDLHPDSKYNFKPASGDPNKLTKMEKFVRILETQMHYSRQEMTLALNDMRIVRSEFD